MPIQPVVGPAGGGKSQYIRDRLRPDDVVLDYTALWAALTGAERDPVTGLYPERIDGDPRLALVQAVKNRALELAQKYEMDGYVTSSDSDDIERLAAITGLAAVIIDPGLEVVLDRLRDAETGDLSPQCDKAVRRWYK